MWQYTGEKELQPGRKYFICPACTDLLMLFEPDEIEVLEIRDEMYHLKYSDLGLGWISKEIFHAENKIVIGS